MWLYVHLRMIYSLWQTSMSRVASRCFLQSLLNKNMLHCKENSVNWVCWCTNSKCKGLKKGLKIKPHGRSHKRDQSCSQVMTSWVNITRTSMSDIKQSLQIWLNQHRDENEKSREAIIQPWAIRSPFMHNNPADHERVGKEICLNLLLLFDW